MFYWTPLSCAVSEGYVNIVDLLVKNKEVDVNIQGNDGIFFFIKLWTPMHEAVSQPNIDIVKILLARDDINLNLRNDGFILVMFYIVF